MKEPPDNRIVAESAQVTRAMGACLSVEEQAALAQQWTPLHKACFAGKPSHVSVSRGSSSLLPALRWHRTLAPSSLNVLAPTRTCSRSGQT